MTNVLLEGPGRTLECVYPKFMVDLVQEMKPNVPVVFCNSSSGCVRA